MVFPLPDWFGTDPATWVLADVCAAIVLLVIEFGRVGIFARLMSSTILLGLVFMAVWMVTDGVFWPPMLFVVYCVRGWRISLSSCRGAMEEVSRVLLCAMVAGIPIAVLTGFISWRPWVGMTMAIPFFLLSAVLHLYPLHEWLVDFQPPD